MPKWPNESSLKSMDKKLRKGMWSATLPPAAGPVERFKYDLCKKILIYKKDHELSQRELAKILGIDESRVSEILHYKISRMTADRLMNHLERLNKKVSFKVGA
jgi:predicted XRE-type DNA-binding protein